MKNFSVSQSGFMKPVTDLAICSPSIVYYEVNWKWTRCMLLFFGGSSKEQRKITSNSKNRQTNEFSQFSQILLSPQLALI